MKHLHDIKDRPLLFDGWKVNFGVDLVRHQQDFIEYYYGRPNRGERDHEGDVARLERELYYLRAELAAQRRYRFIDNRNT